MSNLGQHYYYLGVEAFQHPNKIFTSQRKYASEILKILGCKIAILF